MQHLQKLALAFIAATMLVAGLPQRSDAAVFIGLSVDIGPPALPVYYQPPAPEPNLIWQPGYWAWGPNGYFWVPGTWVAAPQFGYLWTPGYWGFENNFYYWHPGYWATHVGFYGGINYGFGYFGAGYVGGGWFGNVFRYNTAVTNVNTTVIRNVYVDKTVIVNNYNTTRVSYNGGTGVRAYPTSEQLAVDNGPHLAMTEEQQAHFRAAQTNRSYLASVNHGRPNDTVAPRPLTQPMSTHNTPVHYAPVSTQDHPAPTYVNSHVRTNGQPGYHPETLPKIQQPEYHQQPSHPQPYHPQTVHPEPQRPAAPQHPQGRPSARP